LPTDQTRKVNNINKLNKFVARQRHIFQLSFHTQLIKISLNLRISYLYFINNSGSCSALRPIVDQKQTYYLLIREKQHYFI
jgi:hypothetical protein